MRIARPTWSDAAIAVGLLALSLTGIFLAPPGMQSYRPVDAWAIVLTVALVVPVLWRQSAPRTAAWTIAILWMVLVGLGYPSTFSGASLAVVLFGLGAFLPARDAYRHAGALLVLLTGWTVVGVIVLGVPVLSISGVALTVILPVALGRAHRRHQERYAALEREQADRDHAARDATADAIRAERARIARELHDVVAHEMTVMTLQAEGARRLAGDSDPRVVAALATISESGRNGLAEMRRVLGVLRASEQEASEKAVSERALSTGAPPYPILEPLDGLSPLPSLASIPSLTEQVTAAGLPVSLEIAGTAHVPAGVEINAYRIVQEGLTNALKHAGRGARAEVRIHRDAGALDVIVEDDGRGVISDAVPTDAGHGLAGMRERVQAIGGTLEHGPRPGGGYRVHAVLVSGDDVVARAAGGAR